MRIELKFTDDHARRIRYFLGKRYKSRKTTKLESLCRMVILTEVSRAATAELSKTTKTTPAWTGSACRAPFSACDRCSCAAQCHRYYRHFQFRSELKKREGYGS
jgi:hypothetical protein